MSRFFLSYGTDCEETADRYRGIFADRIERKLSEADTVCDHTFDLLGSGNIKVSADGDGYQPIDWHSDVKSGFRWNKNSFYK